MNAGLSISATPPDVLPLLPLGAPVFHSLPGRALVLEELAPAVGDGIVVLRLGESSGGVVLVSVEGKKAPALAEELWKQRILVVAIVHKDFEGLRVTPNIYTTPREIDMFASAMEKLIKA